MSNHPPLRKPRHADGRLMSEDEIRGLDGEALRQHVGVCIMGWRFVFWTDDVRWSFVPPWVVADPKSTDRRWNGSPDDFKLWPGEQFYDLRGIPKWSSDIAAAFEVDRPEWRWEMEDYDHNHFDVTVYAIGPDGALGAFYDQLVGRKPTPQDYARARCVAALLLAAKIGE